MNADILLQQQLRGLEQIAKVVREMRTAGESTAKSEMKIKWYEGLAKRGKDSAATP